MITLTEKAIEQLKKLCGAEKKKDCGLKIDVQPGGCAGFQYAMDFQEKPDKGDLTLEEGGMKIFISEPAVEFMKGTTLDYVESLSGSGFAFNNPNVKSSCHCGKSVC